MLLLIKVNHQEGSDCGEPNTLLGGGTAYRQRLMMVKVCGKGPSTANHGRQTTGPPGQLHCISISLLAFCFSYACQFDDTADRKGHEPPVYILSQAMEYPVEMREQRKMAVVALTCFSSPSVCLPVSSCARQYKTFRRLSAGCS